MLKTHLRKITVAALVFVMTFAFATPAFAEENSDIAAAEDAVRQAQENYDIAVENYNKALEEYNTVVEEYNTALEEYNNNVDVASLNAERENLILNFPQRTVPTNKMQAAQDELDNLQRAYDAGADNWEELEDARYKVERGLQEEQDALVRTAEERLAEIDDILAQEPAAPDSGTLDAAKAEMDRCELTLNTAKQNLEALQQALISTQTDDNNAVIGPQTGDNNTVYLLLVMLILAGAGAAVCAKKKLSK